MAETLVWVDVEGTPWDLVPGDCMPDNVTGRFMPPVTITLDPFPAGSGSRLRHVRFEARRVTTPVLITGTTEADLRDQIRDLVYAVSPDRGLGLLRVVGPSGDTRELSAVYESDLGLTEQWVQTRGGPARLPGGRGWYQRAVITWLAPDPFWQAASDTAAGFAASTPSTFFPFFPLVLTGSEVFDTATVTNPGDVEAWPVWTINGPSNMTTLVNETTGGRFGVQTVLATGDTMTIDTRPGYRTVVDQDGNNLFPDISTADRDMWALAVGANSVRVEMAGFTGASDASLVFRPRYRTA